MKPKAVLRAILSDDRAVFALPRELITTDRVLQRWAVSVGLGLPIEAWDRPLTNVPPLPDDVAIVVDQAICHAPPKTRELITRWYKTPHPVEPIARKLGCVPRTVYRMHAIALEYMRWRFEGSKNQQLIEMIQALPD